MTPLEEALKKLDDGITRIHPEQKESEIFFGNCAIGELSHYGYHSKRMGEIAYDINGEVVRYIHPIFVSSSELESLGIEADPRYLCGSKEFSDRNEQLIRRYINAKDLWRCRKCGDTNDMPSNVVSGKEYMLPCRACGAMNIISLEHARRNQSKDEIREKS